MVDIGEIIAGAVISSQVSKSMGNSDDSGDDPGQSPGNGDEREMDKGSEGIQRLVEFERKNKPSPSSIDAYAGDTVTVPAGGKATITVRPAEGFDLRVKKVYYDRRSDHSYTHMIDGAQLSSNHQLVLQSPRRIMNGGRVVSIVENNSSSSETLDFEFEGWSVPTSE